MQVTDRKTIDSKEFIKTYTNFLAETGSKYPARGWWSTYLGVKERFYSPFFFSFQKLCQDNVIESPYESLMLYLCTMGRRILVLGKLSLVTVFRIAYSKLFLRNKKSEIQKLMKGKSVYLIKSFAYNHSFKNNMFVDNFFGELDRFYDSRGVNHLTVVDILGDFLFVSKKLSALDSPVVSFYCYNTLLDVLRGLWDVFSLYFKVPAESHRFNEHDLTKVIRRQYRLDVINPIHLKGRFLYYAFLRLSRDVSIKKMIMTYENIIWEKHAIASIRKSAPEAEVIGYQHTVVPESATNYFMGKGEEELTYLPDRVLTVGKETKDILLELGNYKNVTVEAACALRHQYLYEMKPLERNRGKYLLIAVEGAPDSFNMVNYIFKQIESLKDWKIVIRTHPILPYKKMETSMILNVEDFPNIEISKNSSIMADLKRVSAVLYWGTTVSIEGLALGIPAIHFKQNELLRYDPLFKCQYLKWQVRESDDISIVLNEIIEMSQDEYIVQKDKAISYVRDYFYPVTDENMSRFL